MTPPNPPRARLALAAEVALVAALLLGAGALRFSHLDRFIASDELRWTCRSINFHTALVERRWGDTFQVGHPGVVTMWLGTAALPLEAVGAWRDLARTTAGCTDLDTLDNEGNEAVFRSVAPLLFQARRGVAAATTVLLAVLYLMLRAGGLGAVPAVAGLALVAFDPFLLAHSRVIHLDAVTSLLALLAVVALAAASPRVPPLPPAPATPPPDAAPGAWRTRWLVLSGALAGLAMLNKASALVLGPAVVAWLAWTARRDPAWRPAARRVAAWTLAAAVAYAALWPAMWVAPVQTIAGVLGKAQAEGGEPHASGNFFLGRPVEDPGPLFYPVAAAFRVTPFGSLAVLAALALVGLTWRASRRKTGSPATPIPRPGRIRAPSAPSRSGAPVPPPTPGAPDTPIVRTSLDRLAAVPAHPGVTGLVHLLLAWALVFTLFMTIGPKKFDRYLLPALAPLQLAGGIAIAVLADRRRLAGRAARLSVGRLAGLVLIAGQAWAAARTGPYPLMYYNPLLGGARTAQRAILVGWGEGYDLAADYLNRMPDAEGLEVAVRGVSNFAPLFHGRTRSAEGYRPGRTDYVVLYINQVQRRQDADRLADYYDRADLAPVHVGTIAGIEVVRILPNATTAAGSPLRLALAQQLTPGTVLVAGGETVLARHHTGAGPLIRYWGHWSADDAAAALTAELPADWHRGVVVRYPAHDPEAILTAIDRIARRDPPFVVGSGAGAVELTVFTRSVP